MRSQPTDQYSSASPKPDGQLLQKTLKEGAVECVSRHRLRDFTPLQLSLLMLTLLFLAAIWSSTQGAYPINVGELLQGKLTEQAQLVFTEIRLPRILLSVFIGAALGLSGALLQANLRNPLADPQIIGVSSGAAVAVGLCMLFNVSSIGNYGLYILPIAAFLGGISVCAFMLMIAQGHRGFDPAQLILIGVAFNAIAAAAIGMVQYLSDDQQLRSFAFWMLGSLSGAQWWQVVILSITVMIGVVVALHHRRGLDLLALGETEAEYAGINTRTLKTHSIIVVALMVGVSVAFSGIIGFVGLVIPHFIRLVLGASQTFLIPLSVLLGSLFLVVADTAARTIVSPEELPIGILTSLIGGPFFLWLLVKRGKSL